MCGIAGAMLHPESTQLTRRMLALMDHRGPDGEGFVDFLNGSLGMCRLRIRGPLSFPLPIRNEQTSTWVSYSGEIYGRVGSDELPPNGAAAEVSSLLQSALEGAQADGMFAFASVTDNAGSVVSVRLSRDPFGIKPLYYRRISNGYAFSSEIAPLSSIPSERLDLRLGAVAEFLAFGRVLGDQTFYQQVESVPPGATVQLDRHGATVNLPAPVSDAPATVSDLRPALKGSIRKCLISDRPVGLALSGGLDSAIIAYELNSLEVENITTLSVCIPGVADGLDDLRNLGLPPSGAWTTWRHQVAQFQPADLLPLIDIAVSCGQPTRMTSYPLYLSLAEAAKNAGVVVLLTGEGADELFAGYPSYHSWKNDLPHLSSLNRLYQFALPARRRAWLTRLLGPDSVSWCQTRFQETYAGAAHTNPFDGLRLVENSLSLEPLLLRTDYSLMLHGIEGRTPYLHGNVPSISRRLGLEDLLPEKETKLALRKAYWNDLPPKVRSNPKRSFRAPIVEWFAGNIARQVWGKLDQGSEDLKELDLDGDGIRKLLAATVKGDEEAANLSFALLALLSWKNSNQRSR